LVTPIDARTRYCAVYGHPVGHSASPAMHNAALKALGLNWRYLAFDVNPVQLREAVNGAKAMGFIGLNLTVPHKLLAMELMDEVDDEARVFGAVNTVVFEGRSASGAWVPAGQFTEPPNDVRARGFNTDADALIRALREDLGFDPAGKRVLVLGAGGAGRVAALRLASANVEELCLVNRTAAKAEDVAREIARRYPRVRASATYSTANVDLVLNATSLGLKAEDSLPFDPGKFRLKQAATAYDMIYRPAETLFLKEAKAAGCRVANGLGMLLYQGARALELWTGQKPPITVMRDALVRNVYGN
jgi:shikimate dehydrogenase